MLSLMLLLWPLAVLQADSQAIQNSTSGPSSPNLLSTSKPPSQPPTSESSGQPPTYSPPSLPPTFKPMSTLMHTTAMEYNLDVQSLVLAQKNICVFVPCSFSVPRTSVNSTNITGSWYRDDDETKPICTTSGQGTVTNPAFSNRVRCLGNASNTDCSFSINNTMMKDSGVLYFKLDIGGSSYKFQKRVTLQVLENLEPVVHAAPEMMAGHNETLVCSVPWVCKWEKNPIFFWILPTPSYLVTKTKLSSELSLTPRYSDNGAIVTCEVLFPRKNITIHKSIKLKVTCDPYKPEFCERNGFSWGVLLIMAAIVEAIAMGLLGAFLEHHFYTGKKKEPAPVKPATSQPEAQPAPKTPQQSIEENRPEPKVSVTDLSELDAEEEQS